MGHRAVKGGDWIAVSIEQQTFCQRQNGAQPSIIGIGSATPFTPGTYAFLTFKFWNGAAEQVFARAGTQGHFDVGQKALTTKVVDVFDVATGRGSDLFLSSIPGEVAGDTEDIVVKQSAIRIDTALRAMLDAMTQGSNPGAHNDAGLLCLDAISAARYWSSVKSLGREYSFLTSNIAITVEEYWEAVQEGAKDGLRNVGETAGAVLSAAGEGVGATLGGFFSGLGIVNTAFLLAGGYFVGKRLL